MVQLAHLIDQMLLIPTESAIQADESGTIGVVRLRHSVVLVS